MATGKKSPVLLYKQSNLKANAKKSILSFLPSQKPCTWVTTSTNLLSGEERNLCVQQLWIRHSYEDKHALGTVSDLKKFISFHSFSKYLLSTYYVHRQRNMFQARVNRTDKITAQKTRSPGCTQKNANRRKRKLKRAVWQTATLRKRQRCSKLADCEQKRV